MQFFKLNPQLAQKIIIPIYFLIVLGGASEQFLAQQIQKQLSGSPGPLLYLFGGLSLLFSLIFPSLLALIYGYGLQKGYRVQLQDPKPLTSLNQMLIEVTRTWGQILVGFLFLILPGLVRYLQLVFVPFVVLFSREYALGRRDALKRSAEIFHKNLLRTLGVLVVFQLVLPAVLSSIFQEQRSYLDHPISALLVAGVETLVTLFLIQGLFLIFQKESQGELNYE